MKAVVGIEQLKVDCIIGCLPHERKSTQIISLDLNLSVDIGSAVKTDNVSDAVNYTTVSELASKVAIDAECQLLERLAWLICSALFKDFPAISDIDISIHKPQAIFNARNTFVRLQLNRLEVGP